MTASKSLASLSGVLAGAVENTEALIAISDHAGLIEYVNPSLCRTFSRQFDVVRETDMEQLLKRAGLVDGFCEIKNALESGGNWQGELSFCMNSGEQLHFKTTVSGDRDDQGALTHLVWIMLDISEQRKLERRNEDNDERLHSLLDNIPAYVFTKDREGKYTYVNRMLAMLHTLEVEDIVGKSDFELFPQDAAGVFIQNDSKVFDEGKTIRALEHGGVDEFGIERHYLSVKCPVKNEEGEVTELLGMSLDISEQHRLERALRASEEKLNSILDNLKARVYIKDRNLKYTYANEELCRLLGCDRINLVGKTDFDLFETETAVGFRTTDFDVFETRARVSRMETSVEPDTSEKRYYWSVKVPLFDAEGEIHSILGISSDVTDQKRLEEALRKSENRLTTILNNINAHVYIKDVNHIYTYVNAEMCRYLGKETQDVIGKTDIDMFGNEAGTAFHESDQLVFNYKETNSIIEASTNPQTGETHYFWSEKVPLINDLGNAYALIGISTDVSDQVRLENELRHLASTDVLTGVHNRRYFLELAERELQRAMRYKHNLSVIMLDVDHFKRINDTYGHQIGDVAIKDMTMLCQKNLRTTDVLGRLGGEEFAIILPETDLEGAMAIAKRIKVSTEMHTFDTGTDVCGQFTASFGVTCLREGDTTPDDIFKRADMALYDAKTQGRNRVCDA